MILEGVVTTINSDGSVNISPMGPKVDDTMRQFVLRPYQTSTTYQNLKRTGEGIFHITDDVELIAHAAVGAVEPTPQMVAAGAIQGMVLADACRWFAFRVAKLDDSAERTEIVVDVVDAGRGRDFFGFNRAKHAVLEAAVLATRVKFLPIEEIHADFARLRVLVDKTGGPAEHRAFDFLARYVGAPSQGQ